MKLRKDRNVIKGATNLDFRSNAGSSPALDKTLYNNSTIESLSRPRPKNFDEILKNRFVKTAPNPLLKTQNFYKTIGKNFSEKKIHFEPILPKTDELLKQKIFAGDSSILFDDKLSKESHTKLNIDKIEKKTKLIKDKHKLHSEAYQETQLIGLDEFNHETLEGKVDLEKIREIRRVIRRKYASRKNLQKVFNLWDKEKKGFVSIKNVMDMLENFGININFNEARVLVASADQDKSNDLSLDEFLQMIFNDNEALNVNLKKMPILSENQKKDIENAMLQFRASNVDAANNRHDNQVKLILKNKLHQLARQFKDSDFEKEGFIIYDRFLKDVRKVGVSDQLVTDHDVKGLYDKYQMEKEDKFNYRKFLKDLKVFEYDKTSYNILEQVNKKLLNAQILVNSENDPSESILNGSKQPISNLDVIRKRAKKVFRVIHRFFGNEQKFIEDFRKENKFPETQSSDQTINKEQLTSYIEGLKNRVSIPLSKKEIAGFLSSFSYNVHGFTVADDVPFIIFREGDTDFYMRCNMQRRGAPPPINLEETLINSESVILEDESPGKGNFKDKKTIDIILQKIEHSIFLPTKSSLNIFRDFDVDYDGFVTREDLHRKIKQHNILNDEEIPIFLSYVDPRSQGYVDFYSFTKKLRRNMLNTYENGEQLIMPFVTPNKDHTTALKNSIPSIRQEIESNRSHFTPKMEGLKNSTRFGATPVHKNTFLNFEAPENSGMFIADDSRFTKGLLATTNFQREEKEKKFMRETAKLDIIRNTRSFFNRSIEEKVEGYLQKDTSKMKAKGLVQQTYELRAHLKNDWK